VVIFGGGGLENNENFGKSAKDFATFLC